MINKMHICTIISAEYLLEYLLIYLKTEKQENEIFMQNAICVPRENVSIES